MSVTNTSDVFSKMLKIQLIATFSVAFVVFFVSGLSASVSAMIGGLSVVMGAYIAAKVAKRGANNSDATAILVNLLKAEAIKILVIIVTLMIAFKIYAHLVPFALIAGLAAAALFSGAALSKLKV